MTTFTSRWPRSFRERGLLRDFPDRTEADLYLWISEHRAALESEFGLIIDTREAAQDLAQRFSPRLRRLAKRLGGRLMEAFTPDELARGPDPGRWRLGAGGGAPFRPPVPRDIGRFQRGRVQSGWR